MMKCAICRVLFDNSELQQLFNEDSTFTAFTSEAQLCVVDQRHVRDVADQGKYLYRLDCTVEWRVDLCNGSDNLNGQAKKTFLLHPIDRMKNLFYATPKAKTLLDPEILLTARRWLSRCDQTCACVKAGSHSKKYPSRLIDLSDLKIFADTPRGNWNWETVSQSKIRLIDTNSIQMEQNRNRLYVTLSHKWGSRNQDLTKLTRQRKKDFEQGIQIGKLPKTFQDAIWFAFQLDRVGYIWIDSLCIVQNDAEDWARESVLMHEVYRNSFLNISATAAESGDDGLESGGRFPQDLWEDEINLNTSHLPLPSSQGYEDSLSGANLFPPQELDAEDSSYGTSLPSHRRMDSPVRVDLRSTPIRRCIVQDVSNWDTLVDRAPINKRGWVFQERLLAPRLIHFCRGRIAWECSGFDAIEGRLEGLPHYRLIEGQLSIYDSIKGLLRELEHDVESFSLQSQPSTHSNDYLTKLFEFWARIVKIYSQTILTRPEDKLVALSGIANVVSKLFVSSSHAQFPLYVAGLWNVKLPLQLLWKLDFVRLVSSRHHSVGPQGSQLYRAPSFSWACIDILPGYGITYGRVLHNHVFSETHIDIISDAASDSLPEPARSVWMNTAKDRDFGMVEGGHIRLWGRLRKAKLRCTRQEDGTFIYSVVLSMRASPPREGTRPLRMSTVYMDRVDDDDRKKRLAGPADIYCLPAVSQEDGIGNQRMFCLLLELASDDSKVEDWHKDYRAAVFRRIGLGEVTRWLDRLTFDNILLSNSVKDMEMPHQEGGKGYNKEGKHLICLI